MVSLFVHLAGIRSGGESAFIAAKTSRDKAVNDRQAAAASYQNSRQHSRMLAYSQHAGAFSVCWCILSMLVHSQYAGAFSVCWCILSMLVHSQYAGAFSVQLIGAKRSGASLRYQLMPCG
jgi:hypothetical protein